MADDTQTAVHEAESRVAYYLDYQDGYLQGPYPGVDTAREFQAEVLANSAVRTSGDRPGPVVVRAEFTFVDEVPEGTVLVLPGEG